MYIGFCSSSSSSPALREGSIQMRARPVELCQRSLLLLSSPPPLLLPLLCLRRVRALVVAAPCRLCLRSLPFSRLPLPPPPLPLPLLFGFIRECTGACNCVCGDVLHRRSPPVGMIHGGCLSFRPECNAIVGAGGGCLSFRPSSDHFGTRGASSRHCSTTTADWSSRSTA